MLHQFHVTKKQGAATRHVSNALHACSEPGPSSEPAYLAQRHVLPVLQLHNVLLAVHDLKGAVRVHLPDVTRVEPADARAVSLGGGGGEAG